MQVEFNAKGEVCDIAFPHRSYSEGAGDGWKLLFWYDGPMAFLMDGHWRLVQHECDHDKVYEFWVLYDFPGTELSIWRDVRAYLGKNQSPVHLMRIDMHQQNPVWEFVRTFQDVTDLVEFDFESYPNDIYVHKAR